MLLQALKKNKDGVDGRGSNSAGGGADQTARRREVGKKLQLTEYS